jgi:hypothetical protein
MFTTLKKMFGGRPAKKARPATTFRPGVEKLDERLLPSVSGYSAAGHKDFYLTGSSLQERDQYGNVSTLASSVSQVSVLQSNTGSARADVLFGDGTLKEWSDATGWKFIEGGVSQVSAGWNGYSAIVGSGYLYLYNTDANTETLVKSGIASASLGLDLNNQAMIGMVTTSGLAYEWRAAGGFETLWSGGTSLVQQVSAGPAGRCALLTTTGSVVEHVDATYNADGSYAGGSTYSPLSNTGLNGTVASISCGVDAYGGVMLDVVSTSGVAYRYDSTNQLTLLNSNAVEVDAGWYGQTDVLFSNLSVNKYQQTGYSDTVTVLYQNYGGSGRAWAG